jgi:hypothetical protein
MSGGHPWRALGRLTHVVVVWAELPGLLGATNGRDRIWLDPRQLQVERRCTLAHELEHLRLGHDRCMPGWVERRVSHAAARRLLPDIARVADALAWSACHVGEAAEELWVDEPTLLARLDASFLTRAELQALGERLAN